MRVEIVGTPPELVAAQYEEPSPTVKGELMAEESVEVVIAADGTVEVHVQGVTGAQCVADTDDLVRLLGGVVEHQELTAEAYQQDEAEEQDRLWQG